MSLSVSNLGWPVEKDDEIGGVLREYDIGFIDIAHSKYFSDALGVSKNEILEVKNQWRNRGVSIFGMQSLFFGASNCQLFGTKEERVSMLKHLSAVARIASFLDAKKLVFGSPKNRQRGAVSVNEAAEIASTFFYDAAEIARQHNVSLCLEPNPEEYGCDFLTTSNDALSYVKRIGHDSLRMNFDTGEIVINNIDAENLLSHDSDFIGHIHISERALAPLTNDSEHHQKLGAILKRHLPYHTRAIEVIVSAEGNHVAVLRENIKIARQYYT